MLSIARSRHTVAAQLVFLATHALGLLVGVRYSANTPDLYPHNAHHPLGWAVTWVVVVQVVVGLVARVAGRLRRGSRAEGGREEEQQTFLPVSAAAMTEHQRINDALYRPQPCRRSNDSGQGTEPNTESLRSQSLSSIEQQSPYGNDDDLELKTEEPSPAAAASTSLAAKIAGRISSRAWSFLLVAYHVVDRTILILGFIAFCTGIIAYARFFVSAHRARKHGMRHAATAPADLTTWCPGGLRGLQRPGALDQGRRVLLVRPPDAGQVVRELWRAGLGKSNKHGPASQPASQPPASNASQRRGTSGPSRAPRRSGGPRPSSSRAPSSSSTGPPTSSSSTWAMRTPALPSTARRIWSTSPSRCSSSAAVW